MALVAAADDLAGLFASLWPHLSERDRRLVAAACARAMGRGGVSTVAASAGLSRPTVTKGLAELDDEPLGGGRVRRDGGGRKAAKVSDPGLEAALEELVDPDARGDPESPLRWTTKSTRQLASALSEAGHQVSSNTVAAVLGGLGYSLQANSKILEGVQHPDRNAQFEYINEQVRRHLRRGEPVISVDSKKKEKIGNLKNQGTEWRKKSQPREVNTYDFIDKNAGKVTPYGIYDVRHNRGFVSVGTDSDTAAFAVAAVRSWWAVEGSKAYPKTKRLLICADAGGSNGYRVRLWKTELAVLVADIGISITVCHFPPGTSKWNKVEHRLFSAISTNWRGQPLTSHEVVVNLIGATTNRGGLTVTAQLDKNQYPRGVKIAKSTVDALPIEAHEFHGEWNYTVRPPKDSPVIT